MPIRRWGSEKLINTTVEGIQNDVRATALGNGRTLVTWRTNVDGSVSGQILDALGNPVGAEMTLRAADGAVVLGYDVTGLADGGFYLVWEQQVQIPNPGTVTWILGRVFSPTGAFVRDQPVLFSNDIETGVVVTRAGAGAAVMWNTTGANDASLRVFDGAGTGGAITKAAASPFTVRAMATSPDGSRFAHAVTETFNVSTVEYETNVEVRNANGSISSVFGLLSSGTGIDEAPDDPVIAWINNKDFVVAWWRERPGEVGHTTDVEMRVMTTLSSNGAVKPVTGVILVNSTVAGDQIAPQVAALPDGRFVVAWLDYGAEYGPAILRMQGFDPGGNRLGGEMIINSSGAGVYGDDFRLAALPDGRVAVTWRGDSVTGTDGDGSDITMQIVDPRDGIVTGTAAGETLYGNDFVNDEISGYGGDDTLYGLRGDDSLWGGAGNDLLDGGLGADDMHGGTGNDTFVVDNAGDAVFELAGQGRDTVQSSVLNLDLALYPNVEGAVLLGLQPLTARGTVGADYLSGALSNGANVLTGLGGNDIYEVAAGDTIVEAPGGGTDIVQSARISLLLANYPNVEYAVLLGGMLLSATGTAGADVLDGAQNSAANALTGLAGDDTYYIGVGDTIVEAAGGGTDTVVSAAINLDLLNYPNVENIVIGGSEVFSAWGNDGPNVIDGAQSFNISFMAGRGGDDTYIVGSGDTITETVNGGTDTVVSALITLNLAAYPNVERIRLTGALALSATGDAGANYLDGSLNVAGNLLTGLGGNDIYIIGPGDTIVEQPGGGTDLAWTSLIDIDLKNYPNVEQVLLTGTLPLKATGTAGNDELNGSFNSAGNVLTGLGGNDLYRVGAGDTIVEAVGGGTDLMTSDAISLNLALYPNVENATLGGSLPLFLTGTATANVLTGNAGANVLTGNGGGDTFIGLGGLDTLIGGAGVDSFRFLAPSDTAVGANRDVIQAFTPGVDRIDLAAIDANGAVAGDPLFVFRGTGAFTGAAGEVRYNVVGADVIVQGTIAGGVAGFEIRVTGIGALTAGDFNL